MIPLTLIDRLSLNVQSDGTSVEGGKSSRSDKFSNMLERLTAGQADGGMKSVSGKSTGTSLDGISSETGKKIQSGWLRKIFGETEADGEGDGTAGAYGMMMDGQSFLTCLKKEFMAAGNCLEDYSVSNDALEEFAAILVKLGFGGSDVEEMVSNFKSRPVESPVTLAELFEASSQLSGPDPEDSATMMLDVSALPNLENILVQLGLDYGTSRGIISDALVEGKGIDLKMIATGIRDAIGDSADISAEMERIGLSVDTEASSQASQGDDDALQVSDLQELAASFWGGQISLEELAESIGGKSSGVEGKALLSKLMQMKPETASVVSDVGVSGKTGGVSESGDISLERFAAILEERVAAGGGLRGGAKTVQGSSQMSEMVNGLMDKVTSTAGNAAESLGVSVVSDGDDSFRSLLRPGMKRIGGSESGPDGVKTGFKNAAKAEGGQDAAQATKQTATTEGVQRQMSSNSTPADSADKLSEALNAAGKDRTNKAPEETNLNMESLVRGARTGDEAASSGKEAASRNLPGYLLNQVSRQIVRLRNAGESELTLQLKPPHLGRMKLNVEHGTGGIRVGIVVESVAAKDMLLANSHDLKAALADQGLRLDRIDVETQTDFDQSMAQADREFGQPGGRRGRWTDGSRTDEGNVSDSPAENNTDTGGAASGRLDLVA